MYNLFTVRKAILATLLMISSYSQMVYSASPGVCSPSNGTIPELHMYINMTAPPIGVTTGQGYTYPVTVAASGLIKCQPTDPAPKDYSAYVIKDGKLGNMGETRVEIGEGYGLQLALGLTPGFATVNSWGIDGTGSPIIPRPIYASVILIPPINPFPDAQDIVITNEIDMGYIVVSENSLKNSQIPASNDGLTHVFLKGTIHIPPKCSFTPQPLAVEMPTVFAADFAAAGVGGTVGTPTRLELAGVCSGGGHEGVADLIRLTFYSMTQGDNPNMIGVPGVPEIGLTVSNNEGRLLSVDGTGSGEVLTTQVIRGDQKVGEFKYPLSFQLISRTGVAPQPTTHYQATVIMIVSID